MKEPYTYTMPEAFMKDQSVPARWRVLGVVNGFLLNGKPFFGSNAWLMEQLDCTEPTITAAFAELEQLGVVEIKRTRRSRVVYRKLRDPNQLGSETQTEPARDPNQFGPNADINADREDTAIAVPYQVVRDEPQKVKGAKKNKEALLLRERLYDLFEKDRGVRPTPTFADYSRVLSAMKRMSHGDIEDLVRDGLYDNKRTVAECLTARNIDIYLQDHA